MAPLRSLGNINSAFDDFYARTGKDVGNVAPPGFSATGGTKTTSGNYTIHTFTSSGSFVVNAGSGEVEYVVVAGGGGGGGNLSGGGGAGGFRSSVVGDNSGGNASAESKLTLSNGTTCPITIGAGGAVTLVMIMEVKVEIVFYQTHLHL